MLLLSNTSTLVRLTNGSAGTLVAEASYVDFTSPSTFAPAGAVVAAISTATTTTIVAAPSGSAVRNLKALTVSNTHASVAQLCSIEKYDGTNAVLLWRGTLQAGERVVFDETGFWTYYGADGVAKAALSTGAYLGSSLVTAASGNFTTGPNTRSIRVRGQGGGGAGGGCTSVASAASAAGGGQAGSYVEATINVSPNTAYAYVCGAAGAGASGAAGGNGGNSTFTVGAIVVTAPGGQGAPVATAVTTPIVYRGGNGGTTSTNGLVMAAGEPGAPGIVLNITGPVGISGNGGSSDLGGGGAGISAVGNGVAGTGYGSGGSGGLTGASAARTGGAGTAGCWAIDEYA